MMIVAACETGVLLLGGLFVCLGSLMLGNANRDFAALASAILFPIIFCLIRAMSVGRASTVLSSWREFSYQLCIGIAFVFLLLFEMSLGLFYGAADIPASWWVIVGGFGMGYVFCFTVSFHLGSVAEGSGKNDPPALTTSDPAA